MPIEVNNFAIRTWNVVLVSEFRFVSENVIFVSEICVLVVEEHLVLGILQFHFRNAVKLWKFAIWFHKMSFLSQKAVSISDSGLYFEI